MTTLVEKLHAWSIKELNLVSEGGCKKVPDVDSFRVLTKGKNKRIWNYVVNHIRSQSTVQNVKRTLHMKKLLREKDDKVSFKSESLNLEELQSAVSKAEEKREYLLRTISAIEEKLLELDQKVLTLKNETFEINLKTAFFELLNQQLIEKKQSVVSLQSQISFYKEALIAYQSSEVCNKISVKDLRYYENASEIEHLDLRSMCSMIHNYDSMNVLNAINFNDLKRNGVHLTDLIVLLKEICGCDLQNLIATNIQNSPDNSILLKKKEAVKNLLAQMKCQIVYNSVSSIKINQRAERLVIEKDKILEHKIQSMKCQSDDLDFELKFSLVQALAENNALLMSNNVSNTFLKDTSDKTVVILENLSNQRLCNHELNSMPETFHNSTDLTYHLMYTASDAFQKVLNDLTKLQYFARKDMFAEILPKTECLDELKICLKADRTLSWNYCDQKNSAMFCITKPCSNDYPLSPETANSLNIKSYQNISFLCENWSRRKQKLQAEIMAHPETFKKNTYISVPDIHVKFLEILEKMKFSIEKASIYINDGIIACHKTKPEIEEWWEQNAQYIPHIEYEGKTLKMWIDILSVLSDFEPPNYT